MSQIKTLDDIKNINSDAEIIFSKKEIIMAKTLNEEIVRKLENKIKETIAENKALEIKMDHVIKEYQKIKEKYEKETKTLNNQLSTLKNTNVRKIKCANALRSSYNLDEVTIQRGADEIYDRIYKKDVDNFIKRFI